jgi:hypothetical protein
VFQPVKRLPINMREKQMEDKKDNLGLYDE